MFYSGNRLTRSFRENAETFRRVHKSLHNHYNNHLVSDSNNNNDTTVARDEEMMGNRRENYVVFLSLIKQ